MVEERGFRMRRYSGFISVLLMLFIPTAVYVANSMQTNKTLASQSTVNSAASSENSRTTASTEKASTNTSETKETTETTEESQPPKSKLNEPSEDKPYPELTPDVWIDVSVKDQKVYFKRGDDVLYTMNCSTGLPGESATPLGEFAIESERGETFRNAGSGEGANYWVSWKDHGVYLFHTVPIDENGNYIESEAESLGVRPASHGCIRLSVPDAKWIFDTVPVGMRVVVRE